MTCIKNAVFLENFYSDDFIVLMFILKYNVRFIHPTL